MDETQKALGRIQATLEYQNDVLDELKAKLESLDTQAQELGELSRNNARQIEEHKKLDTEIASQIGADLEPVKKHVTVWNGVIKVILFSAGVGGSLIGFVKVILKLF